MRLPKLPNRAKSYGHIKKLEDLTISLSKPLDTVDRRDTLQTVSALIARNKMNTHEPTSYSHIVKTMSCVSAPDPISLFVPSPESLPLCRIWFIIPLLFKQYYQVYVYSHILKSLVLLFVF